MRIVKRVYDSIREMITGEPPECGGILGSADGYTVSHFIMDDLRDTSIRMCSYSPNVSFLNARIGEWSREGISFKGIFHTHFAGVETLSNADKVYIDRIVCSMPDELQYLYFPIYVLPDRKMVCYRGEKTESGVSITFEKTEII